MNVNVPSPPHGLTLAQYREAVLADMVRRGIEQPCLTASDDESVQRHFADGRTTPARAAFDTEQGRAFFEAGCAAREAAAPVSSKRAA